jgi:hypothetical protein
MVAGLRASSRLCAVLDAGLGPVTLWHPEMGERFYLCRLERSSPRLDTQRRPRTAPTAYRRSAAQTSAAVALKYSGGSIKRHSLNTTRFVSARQ